MKSSYRQETLFIHAGQYPDESTGAIALPISLSTTFSQNLSDPHSPTYTYSRTSNPTRESFEQNIAASEKGAYAISFSCGCAAIQAILALLSPGDHIIAATDVYCCVRWNDSGYSSPKQHLSFSYIDTSDLQCLSRSFQSNSRLIWIESPTNPTLQITDIEEVCRISHSHNCLVVFDNTLASPYCQSPFDFGVDIIVHSASKYIGGHSDVQMGVVVTNCTRVQSQLRLLQDTLGAVPSPFDCYNAIKGMKTLHLRMKAHSRNAMKVAEFLESHEKIERVRYPGLKSDPQHELAKKQMRYFSGIVVVYLRGGLKESRCFLENMKLFRCAESFGGVESIVKHPALMSHSYMDAKLRQEIGISDNLVRLSIGIECIDDIIDDLMQALDKI